MEKLFLPVTVIATSLRDAQPVASAVGDGLSPLESIDRTPKRMRSVVILTSSLRLT